MVANTFWFLRFQPVSVMTPRFYWSWSMKLMLFILSILETLLLLLLPLLVLVLAPDGQIRSPKNDCSIESWDRVRSLVSIWVCGLIILSFDVMMILIWIWGEIMVRFMIDRLIDWLTVWFMIDWLKGKRGSQYCMKCVYHIKIKNKLLFTSKRRATSRVNRWHFTGLTYRELINKPKITTK